SLTRAYALPGWQPAVIYIPRTRRYDCICSDAPVFASSACLRQMTLPVTRAITLFALAAVLAACRPAQRSGAFPQEAYVWQRTWTPEVRAAIETGREAVEGFAVFSGEISLAGVKPRIVRPRLDYAV